MALVVMLTLSAAPVEMVAMQLPPVLTILQLVGLAAKEALVPREMVLTAAMAVRQVLIRLPKAALVG